MLQTVNRNYHKDFRRILLAQQSMLDAYPDLQGMYKAGDGNTQVYYLKDAEAVFSSFTATSRTVKF